MVATYNFGSVYVQGFYNPSLGPHRPATETHF